MAHTFLRWLAVPLVLCITAAAAHAADILIVSPRHQETVHDNSGNVTVKLDARVSGRERIRLLIDGVPAGSDSQKTTIPLEGIDRGEHILEALLLDEKDGILATSPAVTFYMWRASAQFPSRKPKPKPPPPPPPPAKP